MIKEIFQYFFKLGCIAFGGPAAHIAMMEEDLVEKKKWMSSQEFLDYLGATNLIPGPNSTEMTMHCGYHRGGPVGLFVAGMSFIFPAVCITLLIAILFDEYHQLSFMQPIVSGIKAAVLSFITVAIFKLGKKAVKNNYLLILGVAAAVFSFLGVNEIICILISGILFALVNIPSIRKGKMLSLTILPLSVFLSTHVTQWKLLFIFLKIGSVLFGSGYVLFAYLDGELIDQLQWLNHDDLVEAIAVGQMTPGPVLSTATFIGYKLLGIKGALLATLGIFLPSFFFVWLLNPILLKMKQNPILQSFLQGVNVAAVAVMIVVTLKMAQSIIQGWETLLIALVCFALYFGLKKISPFLIILFGAIAGFVLLG